jgi:hypothetical protein
MARENSPVYAAAAGFVTVGLGCLIAGWDHVPGAAQLASTHAPGAMHVLMLVMAQQVKRSTVAAERALLTRSNPDTVEPNVHSVSPAPASHQDRYYDQLRAKVRWVPAIIGADKLITPDLDSRLLLAKSAARRAGLDAVGLGFKDVYGIIDAESSWVPREGASKDGTPNLGIAQFEPATAKALGLRDPQDTVEAVHIAALHMKEAALWSADRIAGLKLGADEHASKLREGISIYYNLSTRGRNSWNGSNTAKLPRETQRHIQNARMGAKQAEFLDAQLQAVNLGRATGRALVMAGR